MLADRVRMCSSKRGKLIDRTNPVTIIDQNYLTEGNGNRRLVRLKDGRLVTVLFSEIEKKLFWYISKDRGATWTKLTEHSLGWGSINLSLTFLNNKIYNIMSGADVSSTVVSIKIINVDTLETNIVTISQNEITTNKGVSFIINPTGTEIHTCWSGKSSSYPNSDNIRYCKGTIDTDGNIVMGNIEQVSKNYVSEIHCINPVIELINNEPIIINQYYNYSVGYDIRFYKAINGVWSDNQLLYYGLEYPQSKPSSCVDKDGNVHVVWESLSSNFPQRPQVRYCKLLANGTVTPSTTLTGMNLNFTNPSIGVNSKNEIFIAYTKSTLNIYVVKSIDGGISWQNLVRSTEGMFSSNIMLDNDLYFEEPLMVSRSNIPKWSVVFSGKWYE